jgi:hypothetical protein
VPKYRCIESCYDNQRGELFDKDKVYDIADNHQLICFFDAPAGDAARAAKRAKNAKLHAASVAAIKADEARGAAAHAGDTDPVPQAPAAGAFDA